MGAKKGGERQLGKVETQLGSPVGAGVLTYISLVSCKLRFCDRWRLKEGNPGSRIRKFSIITKNSFFGMHLNEFFSIAQ
jgi:hypothetical protein